MENWNNISVISTLRKDSCLSFGSYTTGLIVVVVIFFVPFRSRFISISLIEEKFDF